ncbi:MAG: PilZ domain-containing protein, partial [Porticoccaceae bacterium]|nr:PilZ domain-containing protein [Porticoccaceae bacterium]
MEITREKACQRLHHRVTTPLNLTIDGRHYSAVDWSLGGFRVRDWDRWDNDIKVGDQFLWKFELPFQGFMIAFKVNAEVVRINPQTGHFANRFVDLSERQKELMNHFLEQLIRGAMIPLKDTILRIDSPVTPVSTEPHASPAEQLPVSRIPMRMLMMSLFYLCIGIGLVGLLTLTLYENFLSLKINTAATSVPVESIVSLVDGRITGVSSIIDQPVLEGTTILSIESPQLKKQIAEAKTTIEQKKLELEAQRKRYLVVIETSGSITSKEARLLQIDIDLVEQEVSLAMRDLLALYEYQENLSILSPSDGRLVQLLRERGAMVKRGETLGIFERAEVPVVNVFVTEQEARLIYLNQLTQVHLPSLNQHWLGYVRDIKKDTLISANSPLVYGAENSHQRTIRVEVELQIDPST